MLSVLNVLFSNQGIAMSFFERPHEEVVLASPMSGQITLHGKPVAGAKVVRKVSQNEGESFVYETTTDENGFFDLPELRKTIQLKNLMQYSVLQEVTVIYDGKSHDVWVMGTQSKTMYGELGHKPGNLTCELTSPVQNLNLKHSLLVSNCTWDELEQDKKSFDEIK